MRNVPGQPPKASSRHIPVTKTCSIRGQLLDKVEPHRPKHDLVGRVSEVEAQAEQDRAFGRIDQRGLAVHASRAGSVESSRVVEDHQRSARWVLYLGQPRLGNETAWIGILVANSDAHDIEPGRHFQSGLNDFVSSILSLT